MERKERKLKTRYSKILWIVTTFLLCIPQAVWAYTEFTSGPYTVDYLIEGEVWVFPDASVTMLDGAHIADIMGEEEGNMYVAGIVDFHAGIVDGFIDTLGLGTVTVYGTDFDVSSGTIEPDGSWLPGGGSGTLTGNYENGDPINLLFYSDIPIYLATPGTTNLPPVVIAGQEGLIGPGGKIHPIYSSEQDATVVLGQASDPEGQPIEYRWLEGETVLLDWTTVSTPPQAYLDLSTLDPFSAGDHTLTLKVRETTGEMLEASDDMILRILAAPEITEITIEPTPLGSTTTMTATFTDADGGTHTATIVWEEGGTPESGVVNEAEMAVTGLHTYTTTGVYTVTVTVTDQNGGTSTSTAYAAVYDPYAYSFVTGAGWIADEGSTCGKAFLGFFVRQWGGGDPSGLMLFSWGDNRFRATEFDWLVVSDDKNSAWFFGIGTINGQGEHYFMVEIYDEPDSIRITIFDEYDTGSLVDLGWGLIRIRQWGG